MVLKATVQKSIAIFLYFISDQLFPMRGSINVVVINMTYICMESSSLSY